MSTSPCELDHSGKIQVFCGILPLETEATRGPEKVSQHWNSVLVSLTDPSKPWQVSPSL